MITFSSHAHQASRILFALAASVAAGESASEFAAALTAIRNVALDRSAAEEHRFNAILAYTKVLMAQGRHDEALTLPQEILKTGAERERIVEAALRAGGLVERNRTCTLRAEHAFASAWAGGVHGHAASAMVQELNRAIHMVGALAGRPMVPAPVIPRLPHWAEAAEGRPPGALSVPALVASPPRWYPSAAEKAPEAFRVTLPKFEPPHWLLRLVFPPLKEPRKD